jgi:hypothetical protein
MGVVETMARRSGLVIQPVPRIKVNPGTYRSLNVPGAVVPMAIEKLSEEETPSETKVDRAARGKAPACPIQSWPWEDKTMNKFEPPRPLTRRSCTQ